MPRSSEVKSLLLVLVLTLGRGARCKRRGAVFLPPDSTGLVGTPPADRPLLPLKFWANPRKSPLKPRRKDLDEQTLLKLMGQDFDSRWMRRTHPSHTHIQDGTAGDIEDRATVRTLREMAGEELQLLPDELVPPENRAAVIAWLVQRATCPIRYVWDDLGPYFWPRWVRRGECVHDAGVETTSEGRNSSRRTNTRNTPCSWPPGMLCVPGVARNLQILRWHCRLRKNLSVGGASNSNNVWLLRGSAGQAVVDRHYNSSSKSKRRKRYRCQWLKVPYPVPEDCVCSC
ncbi:Noggin-2 [Zootermopsis nevadensis]|uniref:Noggin-2 n=2 Tax=Zootermopsis nevadensis TaxID=136037 RepID=A0A067R583_ZOONE|nr:Noggin-2 [Zootermopsis nevadensis]